MQSLLFLVDAVLGIYIWLLVIWVVISWLVSFEVINTRNRFVYLVSDFLYRITEPALRRIRLTRRLPEPVPQWADGRIAFACCYSCGC